MQIPISATQTLMKYPLMDGEAAIRLLLKQMMIRLKMWRLKETFLPVNTYMNSRLFKDDSQVPTPREIPVPASSSGSTRKEKERIVKPASVNKAVALPNALTELTANLDELIQQASIELNSKLSGLNADSNPDEAFAQVTNKLLEDSKDIIVNNPICQFLLLKLMDQSKAQREALGNSWNAFTESKAKEDRRKASFRAQSYNLHVLYYSRSGM